MSADIVAATHNMLYWLSQIMTCSNNVTYILHTGAWSSALIYRSMMKISKIKVSNLVGNGSGNILVNILGLFVFVDNVHYRSMMRADDQAQSRADFCV